MTKKSDEDDIFEDDNLNNALNMDSDELTTDWQPQRMDSDTFKQRNDPSIILHRFRLELMQAYEIEIVTQDKDGVEKKERRLKHKKNVKPMANGQGVEELISYIGKFINSHTVQANLTTTDEYNKRLKIISNNITCHFMSNRILWGVTLQNVDVLITYCIELVDMFYTRTLQDKERSHYGEGFKDTTHREIRPQTKEGAFQKFANFISGGKNKY